MQIYNTLTGKKDEIIPIKRKKINLFVCGPTVYDYAHIGHARSSIFFDTFVKYLRFSGFTVFYLQNITDVDDKIIARAREKGVPAKDLAVAFEKEYLKDMKALGVTAVSKYARATSYIKPIISQVQRLLEKGIAYEIPGDGIYFDISKFPQYGKLSGRTALQAEDSVSRIDYSRDKKNRGDFCLWKVRQEESEPSWPSPFGAGRPGWHIEDTAITEKFFGPQYDIHGGGLDLLFPHHEAEITQMESISGKSPLAKYWMHSGLLTVGGQKMSKSLNNFILANDFLKRYTVQQIRYHMLKNLWHSPVDYSESSMIEVKGALEKIEEFLRKLRQYSSKAKNSKENALWIKKVSTDFYAELDDDFNTPKAFAVLFEAMRQANELMTKQFLSTKEAKALYAFFQEINTIFNIIDFKKITASAPAKLKKLAKDREAARKSHDWQKADELRKSIESQGWQVEDTPTGPSLKKI